MVKSEILDRAQDSTVIKIATFTRVAPQAAAQAYALITAADLALLRKFDCHVHQLSDLAGPLVDALKGQDVKNLQQSIALEAYRQHLFEDLSRAYMNADATEKTALERAFETAKNSLCRAHDGRRRSRGKRGACSGFGRATRGQHANVTLRSACASSRRTHRCVGCSVCSSWRGTDI